MFTIASSLRAPSSRMVTSRAQPRSSRRLCAMANGNLRFAIPPLSVAGGMRRSGFCASTAGLRRPVMVAPFVPTIGSGRSVILTFRVAGRSRDRELGNAYQCLTRQVRAGPGTRGLFGPIGCERSKRQIKSVKPLEGPCSSRSRVVGVRRTRGCSSPEGGKGRVWTSAGPGRCAADRCRWNADLGNGPRRQAPRWRPYRRGSPSAWSIA
ncbi:hypothetical protein QOZ94_003387 [Xanthobacter agilis]|uniref:Uncharacterized protein n=1 Tax=Xanthobacter agilis TaxID=47492 RepID=A0ABU0LHF8_XANAG|nr:hypothetical protein [Xanthobacter agilis]